ncbi:MAG: arylesterase [Arenimonas sp.]
MNAIYGVLFRQVQPVAQILLGSLLFFATDTAARENHATKAAAPSRTVLVFGDSLSAGYGLAAAQGWVPLTAIRLRTTHPDWRLVNASISGDTSAGGASRIAAELKRSHPAVVVIELGANDGLRGLSLAQTRDNLGRIIRSAQTARAKVLLVGMRLPPNFGPEYTREFARNYVDLSTRYHTALLPFLLEPIAADRNAFQADAMHPNAAAQPKLRDHVWRALQPLLVSSERR